MQAELDASPLATHRRVGGRSGGLGRPELLLLVVPLADGQGEDEIVWIHSILRIVAVIVVAVLVAVLVVVAAAAGDAGGRVGDELEVVVELELAVRAARPERLGVEGGETVAVGDRRHQLVRLVVHEPAGGALGARVARQLGVHGLRVIPQVVAVALVVPAARRVVVEVARAAIGFIRAVRAVRHEVAHLVGIDALAVRALVHVLVTAAAAAAVRRRRILRRILRRIV